MDVVVAERSAVLELLSTKDYVILARRDSLLVLDLLLHILNRVAWVNVEGDCLSALDPYENLHSSKKGDRGGRPVSESSLDAQLDKYMKGGDSATGAAADDGATDGAAGTGEPKKKEGRTPRAPKANAEALDSELDSYFKVKGGAE
jgi:hypothetical protein